MNHLPKGLRFDKAGYGDRPPEKRIETSENIIAKRERNSEGTITCAADGTEAGKKVGPRAQWGLIAR